MDCGAGSIFLSVHLEHRICFDTDSGQGIKDKSPVKKKCRNASVFFQGF